jgi:ribose transport system ATP-binding protein
MRAETSDIDEGNIAEAIVGRQLVALERSKPAHIATAGPALLEVTNLRPKGKVGPVSLKVAAGEVLGIAGLLGSGRSKLIHAIFGADPLATGDVRVEGKLVARSPIDSVKAGMALVPEDRMRQGLVPGFELWRNITLPALGGVSWMNVLPVNEREIERAEEAIRKLNIKAHSPEVLVTELSGGNAQKVTIGKWLFSDAKIFLLDEPTAGIDVGAKADILRLARELASRGKSVVVVSSEFEELLTVCDRILIMRDGLCIAERLADETTEHELVLLAGGQSAAETTAQTAGVE